MHHWFRGDGRPWFKSYLTDCSQMVVLGDFKFNWARIRLGYHINLYFRGRPKFGFGFGAESWQMCGFGFGRSQRVSFRFAFSFGRNLN